jgi:GINS complex subunit 3
MSRYLDFDTILCEEERVPCTFLLDAAYLGHLHPTVTEVDLPKGTELELPLWLAQSLKDKNMVELMLPKHFRSRMRDALSAGASSVDLRESSFYFYDVGIRLSRLLRDEDLLRTLRRAFCGERFRDLLVHSLSR